MRWVFRILKYTIGLPFMVIYWLLLLVDWLLGRVWSVVQWPFTRGTAHQIQRAIVQEQRSIAQKIVDERGASEKTAREADKRAVDQYWQRQRQQRHTARQQRPTRQKMGYRRKN